MRQEENGSKLNPTSAFSMNKSNNVNNFEKGLSSSIGIDYKIKNKKTDFDFSVAQVINDMENKKMSSESVWTKNYPICRVYNLKIVNG